MTEQRTRLGFEGEASRVSVQPVGGITSTNVQDALDQLAGLVAPKDAEYLVGLADGDLPNARVPTNTATISWDFATANQAKANIADADLLALAGLASNGIATRTATDTWTVRTITGTANEITSTNGDGVSGNPTLSLPAALTFTGKTVTGGTFSGIATTGTLDVQQAFALTGDISPSQITSDQNDYAPTGFSTAGVLRLSTDASRNLTGLAGGSDGRVILIHNVGGFSLVLKDENASSTAGNRFALNSDVTLNTDQSTMLQYDSTSSRWRVIGGTGGGSGGGDLLAANNLSELSGTATTARTNLGIGTGDSPQFTSVNIGHVSDTTLARVSAGVASIEGETIHTNSTSRTVTASTMELGHATDTTLSRLSAGLAGIEGGLIEANLLFRLNASLAGSNATGNQKIFGVGVTVAGSTVYGFRLVFTLSKSAGTTSHTISFGFGGTATVNNILIQHNYNAAAVAAAVVGTPVNWTQTTEAMSIITGAITTAATHFRFTISGSISINAGGTLIPQYSLSAAPGGAYSTLAGSYIEVFPIGASGADVNIGGWA